MNGGSIRILYQVPEEASPNLRLYDRKGSEVRVLTAGKTYADWDGRNNHGDIVASGVYTLLLKAGGTKQTKKIVVVK